MYKKEYKLGEKFKPFDNSWCENVENKKYAKLVPKPERDTLNYGGYRQDEEEIGSIYTLVKLPYQQLVKLHKGKYFIKTFVHIKSNKTGNIYRHLVW